VVSSRIRSYPAWSVEFHTVKADLAKHDLAVKYIIRPWTPRMATLVDDCSTPSSLSMPSCPSAKDRGETPSFTSTRMWGTIKDDQGLHGASNGRGSNQV
jgi:hypothetical protein